jgi:hypothetical protein
MATSYHLKTRRLLRWRRDVQGLLVEVQANPCPMDLPKEGHEML